MASQLVLECVAATLSPMATGAGPVRVLRIIARLNIGGPAIQAITLTRLLEPRGYDTVLLRGRESSTEGAIDPLASEIGVSPVYVAGLRRNLGVHDVAAFVGIMRWLQRFRPEILHTHTAKAGALGRLAALLMPWARPRVIVHTFHGHVFQGEFSPRVSRLLARIECFLARRTTRIVAVSEEVKADLVRLGVAPSDRIEVIRLGFDLSRFLRDGEDREAVRRSTRARLRIPQEANVVGLIARVVKVKRVDRFIEMARLLADRDDLYFLVVGDGDRRSELEASPAARELGERLKWTGFERDIPAMCFAADVVTLTSDNEGTPVCLIEAQAAGTPVVSTRVGGVGTVVLEGATGRVVDRDPCVLAEAVGALLDDPDVRADWGRRGREHVLKNFSIERLVDDVNDLYCRLLSRSVSAHL
jgi:glycosyltransferase involved in cell wall biosynthesis